MEATIATSVFLLGTLVMLGLMLVIYRQQSVQISLDNAAKSTAHNIYFTEQISKIVMNNKYTDVGTKIDELLEKYDIDKEDENFVKVKDYLQDKALDAYIKQQFIKKMRSRNAGVLADESIKEMDFSKSEYEQNSGQLTVVAKYKIKIPFAPKSFGSVNAEKRAFIKVWNGQSICRDTNKVYITKSGKVYHSRKDCPHISISISECDYQRIAEKRNLSGGKYYSCPRCCKTEPIYNQQVYYAEYGTTFHLDLGCPSITRNVIEVDISQVGDRTPCKDCNGN
ncbi:MAG: hypothetical protein K6G88_12060 [Lachnospiraceae bacterium]|nr:hypothetical protein [Lachnospiraceae bacterium]